MGSAWCLKLTSLAPSNALLIPVTLSAAGIHKSFMHASYLGMRKEVVVTAILQQVMTLHLLSL